MQHYRPEEKKEKRKREREKKKKNEAGCEGGEVTSVHFISHRNSIVTFCEYVGYAFVTIAACMF